VKRPALPPIIAEVVDDRAARAALLAACLTIAAAGLDPHILDPGARRIREALAADPSLESLLIASAVIQAGFLLLGGALADIWRSTRIVRVALVGLMIASAGVTLVPNGGGMVVFRLLAWACDGIIVPFSVGVVAQLYRGEARGVAIGVLLGAYGVAQFLAAILLGVFGEHGPEVAAFGACVAVSLAAFVVSRRHLPALPGALPGQRLTIATTALWAWGVIIVAEGLLQLDAAPLLFGGVLVFISLAARRLLHAPREDGVQARAGGTALAAGLVIGFSQAAPLFVMPVFFKTIQGVDPLLASILIFPFVVGLVLAGPAAGLLLTRFTPRQLILAGVWAIAIGDITFWASLGRDTPYLVLILPFVLVGVGFVISTAVRTAVIFASTPKRLAGMAGALNEASLGVGTRMGITLVVLLQSGVLGTGPLESIRAGLLTAAVIGVVGGFIVFVLLGPHDPVRTMWDLRDERGAA
jgi:MFS family permease